MCLSSRSLSVFHQSIQPCQVREPSTWTADSSSRAGHHFRSIPFDMSAYKINVSDEKIDTLKTKLSQAAFPDEVRSALPSLVWSQ